MKQPATRVLYAYWDRLRAGRAAPERGDLDPGAIRTILGDVFLIDVADRSGHAVRLAGTRICSLLGREWTGRCFAEPFAAEDHVELAGLVDTVADAATPALVGVVGETADGRTLDLEMLLLPLRHRGRTRARLLGSLASGEWPYWAGGVPLMRLHLVSVRYLEPGRSEQPDVAGRAPTRGGFAGLRVFPGGRS